MIFSVDFVHSLPPWIVGLIACAYTYFALHENMCRDVQKPMISRRSGKHAALINYIKVVWW
jgi:hypothetical protein